ncbi:hypothetical protein ACOMHN_030405 [Nucella lapillus]
MGKRKKKNKGVDDPMKRMHLLLPVPDDRPNWPEWDRHEVMMSVSMEFLPDNFETDYLAVICPVAKRRTVVASEGWTCTYNKLLNMDRKFQSALPGGNLRTVQIFRNMNDMTILDCLHLKAERTFYILDLLMWKQMTHYESEAQFRFHWTDKVASEMDLTSVTVENEYQFKPMPRVKTDYEHLYDALDNTKFKVDGILFFNSTSLYTPGSTPNVLWLPPQDIERVLGWQPPHHVFPTFKQPLPPSTAAKGEGGGGGGPSSAST